MTSPIPPFARQRRSERVALIFGLEITGTGAGQRFTGMAKTRTVSRYGCCVALPQMLDKYQPLLLRRAGTNQMSLGQVVAPMGTAEGLHLYGVGTQESCESLWGIRFSSSFYEQAVNSVQEGVSFVGCDRQITYWNGGAERLTGYSGMRRSGDSASTISWLTRMSTGNRCAAPDVR
jgi:PAS domain-containing protein